MKVISKKDGTAWDGGVIMLSDCGKILSGWANISKVIVRGRRWHENLVLA